MPNTKPWNTILDNVLPDEQLFTDFRDPQKSIPCSLKSKSFRIHKWIEIIENEYQSVANCLPDGVKLIKVNNNIQVTTKFHTTTGVTLIQGSSIKIWGEWEFTRLQQLVEDNMGIQLLLNKKGWTLVNSPADGHCLLHSMVTAYNDADPNTPIDLDMLFNGLRKETTDNLHMYPKESDMNLISQMEDYIQHKIYKPFYVDLSPSILANYLNVRLHVINEDAQGDCVLYTFDPRVEPMPLAIAVHRKELPDIGPHYSGVVPSKSQKPVTSQRRQSRGGEKRCTLSPSRYPGYVQLGDCSFYTLNEVNNEQHSPLSVILKQRSAISFNLDKYSLLMHCIKFKSPAKFLLNEQYVFVGGNIFFSLCAIM